MDDSYLITDQNGIIWKVYTTPNGEQAIVPIAKSDMKGDTFL